MVDRAQNIKLPLRIVFVAGLQRYRFHCKLDFVVVALLDELNYTVFAGAERLAHIVQFEDLLSLEYTCKARQRLREVHSSLATSIIEHVSLSIFETIVLGGDERLLARTVRVLTSVLPVASLQIQVIIQASVHSILSVLYRLSLHLETCLLHRPLAIMVPSLSLDSVTLHIVIKQSSRSFNVPATLIAVDIV